jgi:short-subunit dehydrogenase
MERAIKTTIYKDDLKDKTVVITGASSGAGRATAIEFAKHGAKIIVAGRNLKPLDEVEAICREMGSLALAVETDVTDSSSVVALAAKAAEFGGTIDMWVNNAGVLAAGEFTETPIEIHEKVIRTNLLGYVYGAHAVLPYFKRQQKGILVNNISIGGYFPVPYSVGYSASKFGLRGYSEALKGELTEYPGIHVCDLYPAFLDTPGIQHAANFSGRILKPAPPVYDPQRVARAIVALAKKPKSYVSIGAVTPVLKFAYFFAPALTRKITVKIFNGYLKNANEAPMTNGNLYGPLKYGTSIHGGWNSPADMEKRKKTLIGSAIVATIATGLVLFGKHQLSKKNR